VIARGRLCASIAASVLASTVMAAGCAAKPADPDAEYRTALLAERAAKDKTFRSQPDQPIAPDRFAEFLPLSYFEPDRTYAVPASFAPALTAAAVQIPTSTGKTRQMEVVGVLTFLLKGQKLSLEALAEPGSPGDRLFVAFSDQTSGTETYHAGRYLEMDRSATGVYVVDFNRAFQPFCYYNSEYDCPYPPARNRLPVPVRAGEKLARTHVPDAGR
jgi:uncharacterized protein